MSYRFFNTAIIPVLLAAGAIVAGIVFAQEAKPRQNDEKSYMPVVIDKDFETIHKDDAAQKEQALKQQRQLLEERYDLRDGPAEVSQGKVLSIKNYYQLLHGKLPPVQLEGMRLLLTPFPQQQFNATEDRKLLEPSLGVTCLDSCAAYDQIEKRTGGLNAHMF